MITKEKLSVFNQLIYANAAIVGFIIMSFEMLGSRYLNPYFGSSIYTWSALITVVMVALTIGYFLGGILADKYPSTQILGSIIAIASLCLGMIPLFNEVMLDMVFLLIDDARYASLLGAAIILLLPLTLLGIYSPYAIRLVLIETDQSGTMSGRIYGISTIGSVLGVLVTTFYLIPAIGTKMITVLISGLGLLSGLSLILIGRKFQNKSSKSSVMRSSFAVSIAFCMLWGFAEETPATSLSTQTIKSLPSGLLEHIESEYNDIFITRDDRNDYVTMSFRRYGRGYTESIRNLNNDLSLPVKYTRTMMAGLLYQPDFENLLMIGLGGGSTTKYINHYYPDKQINVVELDQAVIDAAIKYFGLTPNERFNVIRSDGRVYLRKSRSLHDIIMIDAFRGGYIPFHLLTSEFYQLVTKRLSHEGVLVINLHGGSKLFYSSIKTLRSEFKNIDFYSINGTGNVIVVAYNNAINKLDLGHNALKLQKQKGFFYDLRQLLKIKRELPSQIDGTIFTDDFAPANMYNAIKNHNAPMW